MPRCKNQADRNHRAPQSARTPPPRWPRFARAAPAGPRSAGFYPLHGSAARPGTSDAVSTRTRQSTETGPGPDALSERSVVSQRRSAGRQRPAELWSCLVCVLWPVECGALTRQVLARVKCDSSTSIRVMGASWLPAANRRMSSTRRPYEDIDIKHGTFTRNALPFTFTYLVERGMRTILTVVQVNCGYF